MKTKQIFVVLCLLLLRVAWAGALMGDEIHDAAKAGDFERVKALLDADPELVKAKDAYGTPLHIAAMWGHKEVFALLLARGADVNAKGLEGRTPLFFAKNREVADLLLNKGANVNEKANGGYTPLHFAKKEMAEFLISKGADVNAKGFMGETPLFDAQDSDVAEFLLSKGADINATDDWKRTPLFNALNRGVAELLLNKGANVSARANDGETPLHQASLIGRGDVVKLLLSRGADVNARDGYAQTPLHKATWAKSKDAAETLILNGGDLSAESQSFETPLQYAERLKKDVVVEFLRKANGTAAGDALTVGLAAARQEQWTVAIRHFQKAQVLTPDAPAPLFNLGLAESKVAGRELRAVGWFKAYLLAAPTAANAVAVAQMIVDLNVRVEGTLDELVGQAKQLAGNYADADERKMAFHYVALAQAKTGDIDGARQTASKAISLTLPDVEKMAAKMQVLTKSFTATERLTKLIGLIRRDMAGELFTDPQSALQTIATKPTSKDILNGMVNAIEQIADRFNDIKNLNP